MAVAQGYGKTVTSGSVFAYDTGDTVNSYRGEPTVNGVGNLNSYNPLDLYTWAPNGNTSTWARDTSAPLSPVKGIPLKEISSGTDSYSDTYNGSTDNIIAASSGQTWTVSVYALAAAGTNIQVWIFGANSSGNYVELALNGYGVTATGQWQRISVTMTFSNGSTAYVQSRVATSTNGGVIWWDGLQVEQKSYPTQFVNGTRSATQGLLPLVGNSTLDLSNVSFDSNAQMTFDGSDDRILTSENITLNGSQTFEVITTISGGPQSPAGIISNHDYANTSNFGLNHISSNRIGISIGYTDNTREYDSKYTTYAATIGTPFHLVMTFDQPSNTVKLYVNGALDSTFVLTKTVKFTNRPIVLGRWDYQYNYYYFNGKVPAAKVYTRALSAGEVRQNYLHYKTRFNLS